LSGIFCWGATATGVMACRSGAS